MPSSDDKYIIRPGGSSEEDDHQHGPGGEGEEPSLEQYVFANSVVQTGLIQLLVEKKLITLEELTAQVEKVREGM